MRIFVAITPPEDVIEHLDHFLDVRRTAADFHWSPPGQWHLTLAFAGHFPSARLPDLEDHLAAVAERHEPLSARLFGGGTFPNVAAARVLWMGIQTQGLDRLATHARNAVARSGGDVDGQPFRAHLTLARLRRPQNLTRWTHLLDAYDGPVWTVDHLSLIESHLEPSRAHHNVLAQWPLTECAAFQPPGD